MKTDSTGAAIGRLAGHTFRDNALAVQALTHSSWANEHGDRSLCNERLEYLGDAVLELTVSDRLYRRFPGETEGRLTRMRADVVSEPMLAETARRMGLGDFLRMSYGERKSGGAEKPAILADAFEALAGAIYLDAGMEAAAAYILRWLGPALDNAGSNLRDHKTELQEKAQQAGLAVSYAILEQEGPAHARRFLAAVYRQGEELARAWGTSKKDAEQHAAKAALEREGGK